MVQTEDRQQDASLAELLQRATEQTQTLVRQELRLAQLELREKGRRAGAGAGLFGAAGLTALFGVGALVAAAIIGLATALDAWLAALIVGAALLALSGVMALTGKGQVQRATPPVPEQATESVRADVDEVKERVHDR
ncbi:phage holin family protein [Patulibacter brassicae]|uniref:Phage holin family protein n=1 Tax=Patulibacter brassicae TaxID=1705717 RepID=A0ABU4VNU9_9ACTN|nr:phage holin family protein [Patulibacter brassicae]MDX8153531.1 phage holin family protein [Patulibacter brassicae]